jgi:hypothetical protein
MIRDSNKMKYNACFFCLDDVDTKKKWTQTLKNLKEH